MLLIFVIAVWIIEQLFLFLLPWWLLMLRVHGVLVAVLFNLLKVIHALVFERIRTHHIMSLATLFDILIWWFCRTHLLRFVQVVLASSIVAILEAPLKMGSASASLQEGTCLTCCWRLRLVLRLRWHGALLSRRNPTIRVSSMCRFLIHVRLGVNASSRWGLAHSVWGANTPTVLSLVRSLDNLASRIVALLVLGISLSRCCTIFSILDGISVILVLLGACLGRRDISGLFSLQEFFLWHSAVIAFFWILTNSEGLFSFHLFCK